MDSDMKQWLEWLIIIAILFFFGYGAVGYLNDYHTVERWQAKAYKTLMDKVKDADSKKLSLAFEEIDKLGWIHEPTSKIAFDVWLGTTANLFSIIGTIVSIVALIISRKRKGET